MRVADLRDFLQSLIPPLESSGAKKEILNDLGRACDALAPFGDHAVGAFAEFLGRCEEYDRTGVLPASGRAPSKPRAAKAAAPKMSVDEGVAHVEALYDAALGATQQQIADGVKLLDKLGAKEVTEVAKRFGVAPRKTKADTLKEIEQKIARRLGTHERVQY